MKRKRHNLYGEIPARPSNARRSLRTLWSGVKIYSCADGTLRIEPRWRKRFSRPGVLTRMYTARMVQDVLGIRRIG